MKARFLIPLLAAACASNKPTVTQPAPPPTNTPTGTTEPTPTASPAPAPLASAKAHKVRTVEGITEYRLDNGLSVLLFPDQTQSTITVNITYLVGSRLEGYGETGMAHLLEHMMFKGSPRHRNVLKLLDERGGQANGTTWYDRTNYYETLPASQENLDWTLDLESDRMINAAISPDDLKTEFSVVRNEFESGENDPSNILDERVTETAYLWHNYGKPTIGSRTDIERVPVPALRKFYEKYYQPDNALLIVAGKFDDAATLASIEKLFGAIPKPARVLADSYTIEPVQDGERTVTLRRNGDVYVIEAAYHTVAGASADFAAAKAAVDLLVHEGSGRLYKKLVETKLAANIDGSQAARRDPFIATFVATVRDPKNVEKVEQIMLAEIEGLGASKIDDKEVDRYRVATEKQLELFMTNSRSVAVALTEFAALGDWRSMFAYREQAKKVTAADVARVAKQFFKPSNRTLGRFIPTKDSERAPLEQTPDITAYVKGIDGGDVKEQGEVFVATLDNIEARTQRKELKGGIKAALLSKKTRGGKVALTLRLHWGDEKALQNKGRIPEMMGAMLSRGTAKKSYQDLQDEQDKLKAHVSISASADGLVLRIDTLRDKLPAAIDLAAEMLKDSTFPDKQLEVVRNEMLAGYEQQLQDPGSVAFTTLAQLTSKWPKGDPRHPSTIAEQIDDVKKINAGAIKQFYKDFVGAGHGELAIVGDFDGAAVSTQLEKLFGGWTTKKPYARLAQKVWTDVPGQQKSINIKDKEQTTIALGHDVAIKDTDDDYAALLMISQVLGGDTGSRAWMRLREHEGLSYGVATWAFADAFDEAGGVGGYAIVAPQNLAKAKASLLDEFQKIATGKVGDEELKRAKDTWLKEQDTSLSSDGYVVNLLVGQLYRGRTTEFTKRLRAKVAALTTADVEKVAQKRVDPKRLVIVDAGDQAKATAAK
jgi:zinc protease